MSWAEGTKSESQSRLRGTLDEPDGDLLERLKQVTYLLCASVCPSEQWDTSPQHHQPQAHLHHKGSLSE